MLAWLGSAPWAHSLGNLCGTLNILGVAPAEQGRGIGMALVDRAATLLRDRGCTSCLIGETGLKDWYGKLGATLWSEYYVASKPLINEPTLATHPSGLPLLIPQTAWRINVMSFEHIQDHVELIARHEQEFLAKRTRAE